MTYVTANGIVQHYRLSGSGPGLLLAHELGGDLQSWAPMLAALGDGYSTLRMDLRSAGASEKPRAQFSIADLAADLEALVMELGVPAPLHAIGAAAGNAPLLLLAHRRPDLIRSLTACNPAFEIPTDRREYLLTRALKAETAGMRAIADSMLARSWPEDIPGGRAAYRARLLGADPVGFAHANRAFADFIIPPPPDIPVQFLCGDRDLLRPVESVLPLRSHFPGVAIECLAAGHLAHVQNPASVATHLRKFLEF